jgi:hydrogenase/urease accessory protein HupE
LIRLVLHHYWERFPKVAFLFALTGSLVPSTASAHLVNSGIGPFYDGIAHFFVSPEDLVLIITLALFGGLSGRKAARLIVVALPVVWLAGAAIGMHITAPNLLEFLQAVGIFFAGLLLAINPKVPRIAPSIFASVLGLVHGWLNGQAMATTNTPFLAAVGIISALGLAGLLLGALAASLKASWQVIAARVLGSWAAAIGLLTIAWNLRPGA